MAKFLITGGAGFIGSHFCDEALRREHTVCAFDSLETGKKFFLKDALKNPRFHLREGDIRRLDEIQAAATEFRPDWIIHLAANADVRRGLERPRRDLDYNTTGTWNVAESARVSGCKRILFSSTGSVYGEPEIFPTPEECPFPEQTSLYAASKLAGETILSAYAHGYGIHSLVFRFVSILGPRYTHGHIFDFMKMLKENPNELLVLGNGMQLKSYLHIEDLMRGLWTAIESKQLATRLISPKLTASGGSFTALNIGHSEALTVNESIGVITAELGLKPKLNYSGGERGWIGDSPRIQLECSKMHRLDWMPRHSLAASVRDTVKYLKDNSFLLDGNES